MALLDVLLEVVDPVNALLLIGIWKYIKALRIDIKQDLKHIRGRVNRAEDALMTDGGDGDGGS